LNLTGIKSLTIIPVPRSTFSDDYKIMKKKILKKQIKNNYNIKKLKKNYLIMKMIDKI
jgi:hypothetical protein